MSVGLLGAHRTGKSTLAREFAQATGVPFVATSTTAVFAAMGKDPAAEYPLEERLHIQEVILYALVRQLEEGQRQSPQFITDRTPMDLAAYMLADVSRRTLVGRPDLSERVENYMRACIRATERFFSAVVTVQPGIPFVEEPGKPQSCISYQEHLNALVNGLMQDVSVSWTIMPRHIVDLNMRLAYLREATEQMRDAGLVLTERRKELGIICH